MAIRAEWERGDFAVLKATHANHREQLRAELGNVGRVHDVRLEGPGNWVWCLVGFNLGLAHGRSDDTGRAFWIRIQWLRHAKEDEIDEALPKPSLNAKVGYFFSGGLVARRDPSAPPGTRRTPRKPDPLPEWAQALVDRWESQAKEHRSYEQLVTAQALESAAESLRWAVLDLEVRP